MSAAASTARAEPEEEPIDRSMMSSAGDASTGVPSTATLAAYPDASATAAPSAGVGTAARWIGPQTPRDQKTNTLLEKETGA